MKKIKLFLEKNSTLSVVLAFILLVLIFTYPLAANFFTQIPEGRGDIFQALGNINLRVQTFESVNFSGKISFLLKNINVYLPYVLLNPILGKYGAYNFWFLFSFVMSGVGAYLLAFYFTKNKLASLLAGLIFAFSPFHFYQATVVNLGTMHQEWLPFFALFLFRFFEKFQFKYFLGFIIFSFLIAMEEHQMLAFAVLFVLFFLVYKFFTERTIFKSKKLLIYAASSIILLAIVAFGMFGAMLKVALSENNFLSAGIGAANKYSIEFLDPVSPPGFHAIWPNLNLGIQKILLGDAKKRGSYFLGFTVIALVIFLARVFYKKRKNKIKLDLEDKNILFWFLTGGVFYIFSLGASLSIGKHILYLPYFLIYKFFPFYENIRTTGRMFVFMLLAFSMLAAYGLVLIFEKYAAKKFKIFIVVSSVILLEFWVAPIALMKISHSSFYDNIAKDGKQYALIEVPGSTSYEFASYEIYLSTIHKKKVLNGMPLARKIKDEFAMQQDTPVIKQLLYTIPKGNDPDTKFENPEQYFKDANKILNANNVEYITISKEYAQDNIVAGEIKFIEKYIKYESKYEDAYLIAYKVAK